MIDRDTVLDFIREANRHCYEVHFHTATESFAIGILRDEVQFKVGSVTCFSLPHHAFTISLRHEVQLDLKYRANVFSVGKMTIDPAELTKIQLVNGDDHTLIVIREVRA